MGLWNLPAVSLHLWCIGRHSWIPCTIPQTKSRPLPAPSFINDFILRASSKASLQSVKEPRGLLRSDNKRPDGLILIPWRDDSCATWDVTVKPTDTVASSYLSISSACAAAAAEAVSKRKEDEYTEIACNYHLLPIAFETFGPIIQVVTDFISALGHRILSITDDLRESFLSRRLSVAIQRFNADCFANSFGNIDVEVQRSQPETHHQQITYSSWLFPP